MFVSKIYLPGSIHAINSQFLSINGFNGLFQSSIAGDYKQFKLFPVNVL